MSKKDKSAKLKNQVKLDKSEKKELKKDKLKLKNLEKHIKKGVKAIEKLNKELKKEEKDLNKLQAKKENLLVAYKLLNISQEENTETEVQELEKTTETPKNNAPNKAPVAKRAVKKTSNVAAEQKEETSKA